MLTSHGMPRQERQIAHDLNSPQLRAQVLESATTPLTEQFEGRKRFSIEASEALRDVIGAPNKLTRERSVLAKLGIDGLFLFEPQEA